MLDQGYISLYGGMVNPYVLSLDVHTATGRQPGLYKKFVNISFNRTKPELLRASEILRKWAIRQTTRADEIWLENLFVKLFQDHFTPIDCPQVERNDFNFTYYGDGSFKLNSIQGVIGETAGETQIKWTFRIEPDGSNQILNIEYDGDYEFYTH